MLVALAVGIEANANAHSTMSGGDGCNWYSHGEEVTIDGVTYRCVCGRMTGPSGKEIVCHWRDVSSLAARRVRRPLKKPSRFGISSAVLSGKVVAS